MKLTRDAAYISLIGLLIVGCSHLYYGRQYLPEHQRKVDIYYNQSIEANKKVVEVIQNADRYVYFAIHTFTRTDIKDALLGAQHRGLDVRGVMDRKQSSDLESQRKIYKELTDAGISIATQDHAAIMHLKTVITEKEFASGSYN